MARYFFDIHDGQHLTRDHVGTECKDPDDVEAEVAKTLPAIARDSISKYGGRQALMVIVRDLSNLTVFTATLTYTSAWLRENVSPETEDPSYVEHLPLTWGQ